jgi:predicted cupin superfamily sugar epimerase
MSVALQDMSPYARSIVERLGLETHPEGGWYTRDWQSPHTDEASSRPLSSLIYFLLPEGDASAWHKVDADEVWLWHGPASVKLELGGSDETPESDESKRTVITLGSGHRSGRRNRIGTCGRTGWRLAAHSARPGRCAGLLCGQSGIRIRRLHTRTVNAISLCANMRYPSAYAPDCAALVGHKQWR